MQSIQTKTMRFSIFGALGLLLIASCSAATYNLSGTIITDRWIGDSLDGKQCQTARTPPNRHTDLAPDSPVKVFNSKGEIIALGKIGTGIIQMIAGSYYCVVNFSAANIPSTGVYRITFGNQDGIDLTLSKEDLQRKNWNLELNAN